MASNISKAQRRVAMATLIGSAIEWYDFFIFGTAAALVFGELFFPQYAPTAGTLLSFGTFAVAWVGRPIGGIIAGHFGDRIGRKRMLVLTLTSMGAATTMLGLLPTYAAIGIWAPILLVTLRIIQGISIGGEFGGGIAMAVEHAPEGRRGLFGSFPQFGLPLGLILGSLAFLAVAQLPREAFLSWGWRVPFLVSVILLVTGLYVRLSIEETPEFITVARDSERASVPFIEVWSKHPFQIVLIILANAASNVFFYTYSTFFLAYLTSQLRYDRSVVLLSISIAAVVQMATLPVAANLADRIGRKKIYVAANLGLGITVLPAFFLLSLASVPVLIIVQAVCLGFLHASSAAAAPSLYADMFPANVRYTGISLGYQISGLVWAGPLPTIASALLAAGTGKPWYFACYLMLASVVTAISMSFARVAPQNSMER